MKSESWNRLHILPPDLCFPHTCWPTFDNSARRSQRKDRRRWFSDKQNTKVRIHKKHQDSASCPVYTGDIKVVKRREFFLIYVHKTHHQKVSLTPKTLDRQKCGFGCWCFHVDQTPFPMRLIHKRVISCVMTHFNAFKSVFPFPPATCTTGYMFPAVLLHLQLLCGRDALFLEVFECFGHKTSAVALWMTRSSVSQASCPVWSYWHTEMCLRVLLKADRLYSEVDLVTWRCGSPG